MTEQERLSEDYSALKERYWLLKKAVNIDWEELMHRYEILQDKYNQKEVMYQQALKDKVEMKEKMKSARSTNSGEWVLQSTHMKKCEQLKELQIQLRKYENIQTIQEQQ